MEACCAFNCGGWTPTLFIHDRWSTGFGLPARSQTAAYWPVKPSHSCSEIGSWDQPNWSRVRSRLRALHGQQAVTRLDGSLQCPPHAPGSTWSTTALLVMMAGCVRPPLQFGWDG